MNEIELSNGSRIDLNRITKVALWLNPTRLQIDLDDENQPPFGVYGDGAVADADNLDAARDEFQLKYLVFRPNRL